MSVNCNKLPEAKSWLKPKARHILQDIVSNADLALDERVLAWAKLKAWDHGQDFACCRVRDLQPPRANVLMFDCWRKEDLPAAKARLVVASQGQCAYELKVPVERIRAAAARLVKRELLTTPWVHSHLWVTKHKIGVGFRAVQANMLVRAFCPVREVDIKPTERPDSMAHQEFTRQKFKAVLGRLQGSVWHTTSLERYRGIVRSGAILPEPDIKDTDRWSTSQGSQYYPFVRTLGGVSLFDFRDFDPVLYSGTSPNSTWWEFVPFRSAWGEAVWIEIDVSQLGDGFISGPALLAKWNAAQMGNKIMPEIEAAHVGPVPRSAFKEVLFVRGDVGKLEPLGQ